MRMPDHGSMPARHSDPSTRALPEHGSDRLPVFVAGRAGLETHHALPVFYDQDRPEPDWRMATVPLYRHSVVVDDGRRGGGGDGGGPADGWPPAGGWSGGRPTRRRTHRAGLGRRAVVAIAVAAVLAGAIVGAGVSVLAHHDAQRAVDPAATSVKVVTTPAASSAISQVVTSVSPAVVEVTADDGDGSGDQGTGMIVTAGGEVLTNDHVVDGATAVTVSRNGSSRQLRATVVGADPDQDVALLQIAGAAGLPTVSFADSSSVQVGDSVVAIGNALALGQSTSVTSGIVSALGRTITAGDGSSGASETLTDMIQTDAAINPGNSGGVLLDTAGQVIGMNTAAASPEGSSAEDIGFAIPSDRLLALLPGLRRGGDTAGREAAGPGDDGSGFSD
jgi:S1-C subfamily serine protease